MIDSRLLRLTTAPFSPENSIHRVMRLIVRYRYATELAALEVETSRKHALTMTLLQEHPSALLEMSSVEREVLERRLVAAEAELVNLRSLAPVPAPAGRADRSMILAFADLEHFMREFRALRRAGRRVPLTELVARYPAMRGDPQPARRESSLTRGSTGRENSSIGKPDPLSVVDAELVRAVLQIQRGQVLRVAAELAGLRHGVSNVRGLLAPEPSTPLPRVVSKAPICVGRADTFKSGVGQKFEAAGRSIAVFLNGGRFFAIDDACPHRGGPLHQGDVEEGAANCPLHGWAFDLETGEMRGNPRICVATYAVDVREGEVFVDLPARARDRT